MDIKRVVVTGDKLFIARRHYLFKAMSSHFEQLAYITSGGNLKEAKLSKIAKNYLPQFILNQLDNLFRKNANIFQEKSEQIEKKIRELQYTPDLVFHMFSMYCPFWNQFDIPYVIYLDYNMALAHRNWSPWAPFPNRKQLNLWFECERKSYENSHHIFAMSKVVRQSLIEDYGISSQKITVVGNAGNYEDPYQGEKTFSGKQILFNGSDFERKGGDLVLAAFQKVKEAIPDAKLVVIGKKLATSNDGIENPGHISSASDIRDLFLKTDLVVSPAYCDPFPLFVMEAMNYGVPCIVSANDGMPEIVDHEVNGIVIDKPTPESLANHIIKILSNKSILTSMSHNARNKIQGKLNWHSIAKNIWQVLSTM